MKKKLKSIIVLNGDVQKLADALEKYVTRENYVSDYGILTSIEGIWDVKGIEPFILHYKTSDQFIGDGYYKSFR